MTTTRPPIQTPDHRSLLQRKQSEMPTPREQALHNFHTVINAALKPSFNVQCSTLNVQPSTEGRS
jgi:hypothetical protein